MGSGSSPKLMWVVGCAVLVVAAGSLIAMLCGGQAEVKGTQPDQRIESIAKLATDKPRGAANAIAATARDADPAVRRAAMVGLSQFVQQEHRPVVEQGTRDSDPTVRDTAVATLSLYQDADAADALGELLTNDPDKSVRITAAQGLATNPSPKSIVLLLENAEKNDFPEVQFEAMSALLSKLGTRFWRRVDPVHERPQWRTLIAETKRQKLIQKAYADCGVPLMRRAEDEQPYAPGHTN